MEYNSLEYGVPTKNSETNPIRNTEVKPKKYMLKLIVDRFLPRFNNRVAMKIPNTIGHTSLIVIARIRSDKISPKIKFHLCFT